MIQIAYDEYITVVFDNSNNEKEIKDLIDKIEFISTPESFIVTQASIKNNIPLYESLIKLGVKDLYTIPFNDKYYFIKDFKIDNEILYY